MRTCAIDNLTVSDSLSVVFVCALVSAFAIFCFLFSFLFFLRQDAVVDFTTALCVVSADEVAHEPPRIFSLQKLVELTSGNMDRIRIVWGKLWAVLSSHFVTVGSHRTPEVALYAIDSLRQLSVRCAAPCVLCRLPRGARACSVALHRPAFSLPH